MTREPKLKIFKFRGHAASTVGQSQQSFQTLYAQRGVDWDQLVLVREVRHTHTLVRQPAGSLSVPSRPTENCKQRCQQTARHRSSIARRRLC